MLSLTHRAKSGARPTKPVARSDGCQRNPPSVTEQLPARLRVGLVCGQAYRGSPEARGGATGGIKRRQLASRPLVSNTLFSLLGRIPRGPSSTKLGRLRSGTDGCAQALGCAMPKPTMYAQAQHPNHSITKVINRSDAVGRLRRPTVSPPRCTDLHSWNRSHASSCATSAVRSRSPRTVLFICGRHKVKLGDD